MVKKGFQITSKCQCCYDNESMIHIFLTSAAAKTVWDYFGKHFGIQIPISGNIQLVIQCWRISSSIRDNNHIRTIVPLLIIWFLWKERNERKHKNKKFSPHRVLIKRIIFYLQAAAHLSWKGNFTVAAALGVKCTRQNKQFHIHKVLWHTHALGWAKLNTDGASRGNPGPARIGGLI